MLAELRALAARNTVAVPMIGLGYHGTAIPGVIQRNVLENPAWYTAYTPYQPEISQGRLEALLNFQTVVEDLTGLAIANASLLDEATAAAEAMTLMRRTSKAPAGAVLVVDADVLPQTARSSRPGPSRSASRSSVGRPVARARGRPRGAGGRVRRPRAVPRYERRRPRPRPPGRARPTTRARCSPSPPTCWPSPC